MTVSLSDVPHLLDKKIRKIWIKDGSRKMTTDSGFMKINSDFSRRMFGRLRGGKYSQTQ